MKPVLAWVKSNVLIVIFSALILILLPASWFVSSWWSKKINTTQQTLADAEAKKIQAARMDYTLPQVEPGVAPVSFKGAPNRALIQWFQQQRQTLTKQAGELVTRAEAFNKGVGPDAAAVGRAEHAPLVEGLFPAAASKDIEIAKLNEMEDTLLGLRGKPNPYMQLLDSIHAGPPADPLRVGEAINDMKSRETERITALKRELTPEEQAELQKKLSERRMAEYQARVSNLSVYATMDSLPRDRGSSVPTGSHIEASMIEPGQFFQFQWDYWVLQDLLAAVKLANTTADGRLANVDRAVVKRIDQISLDAADGLGGGPDEGAGGRRGLDPITGQPMAAPAPAAPGMVPVDLSASITGRSMGPQNTVYDIRRATITVVVSSARLQDFLEAIPRTNFMTVTKLDLQYVEPWEELKRGYFYGPENVVRATIQVETVWLRSWMTAYMPAKIKSALKVPEAPAADPAAPAPTSPGAAPPGRGPG